MSKSTTPEEMEEFIHWRTWRAPKFIVMQPSGNLPYDATVAWEREDGENTEKYLHGLSERFRNGLVFHLQSVVGEAYVKLAKKGIRVPQRHSQAPSPKGNVDERSDATGSSPSAFMSYSWDSEAHKKWVLDFATKLQAEGGVRIILDQWYLPPGGDRTIFMEKSLSTSKFVILICTPNYAERANNREGGVGYEATIITGELAENINQGKFLPVLRAGEWNSSLPVWIKTKVGIDLRNNPFSHEQYQVLLRTLYNELPKPPPVGPKPIFGDSPTASREATVPRSTPRYESLTTHEREAIRRKLTVARINALHPRLIIWVTNRADFGISVKSGSLWHGQNGQNHKCLSRGVLSDSRESVEIRPRSENTGIAFMTDDDAMLKLQSLGVVERHLATHTFRDDVDLEVRIEYAMVRGEDEYRETLRVRVHGNRQIESL